MRARYCAYALGDAPFILATWHPQHRPHQLNLDSGTRYRSLRVHRAQGHEVEFTATLRSGGETMLVHERSRFTQLGGRWVYVDEVTPPVVEAQEA